MSSEELKTVEVNSGTNNTNIEHDDDQEGSVPRKPSFEISQVHDVDIDVVVDHEEEEEEKQKSMPSHDDVDEDAAEQQPLQASYDKRDNNNNANHTEEDADAVANEAYNIFLRRNSISTSDVPHSLQVLTPQHQKRPRDDVLAKLHDMGFDRALGERAYDRLLAEHNGDHGAFNTEQVIEMMLTMTNESDDDGDIRLDMHPAAAAPPIPLSIRDRDEEEEAVPVVEVEEEEAGGHRSGDWMECPICCMDRPPLKFYRANCGHNYCHICLETHYKGCIENGIVSFVCMADECERKIDENELFQFLNDDAYKQKYFKFQRNVKLAQDHNVRWCVKAGCDTPIRRKSRSRKQQKLECPKCGTCVCYNCAGLYFNDHDNAGKHHCNKQLDDKLTAWAKSGSYDVQFCPKCCARIEKLAGCNHMQCAYCKYEFCWLCRREFRKGHYDPNNIVFGCPNAENAEKRPNRCSAFGLLMRSCMLMCCLPLRICCWRMSEQGFPWCCCWCCCD